MYCSECGTKLDEGTKFCGSCGAKQQQQAATEVRDNTVMQSHNVTDAVNTANTVTVETIKPKKKSPLIKIVSVFALVAIVITGGVIGAMNFPKILGLFSKQPSNSLAVTANSIVNLSDLSYFDYKITVTTGDEYSMTIKGFLALGKDLYSSVLNLELDQTDIYFNNKVKAFFYDGDIGGYSKSVYSEESFFGASEYEEYEYMAKDDIIDELIMALESMGIDPEELNIDFNKFVKNGKFNGEEFKRIGDELSKNPLNYLADIISFVQVSDFADENISGLGLSTDEYLKNLEKLIAEINALTQKFLLECEKEEFINQFISNDETVKEGGSTTYNYTLNVFKFANTFVKYIIESVDKKTCPEIYRVLEKLADEAKMENIDELLTLASYSARTAIDDISTSLSDGFNGKIKFSLTVSKSKQLEKLSVSANVMDENISFKLSIENRNKVNPEISEIKAFMKKAEENNEDYKVYDDYDNNVDSKNGLYKKYTMVSMTEYGQVTIWEDYIQEWKDMYDENEMEYEDSDFESYIEFLDGENCDVVFMGEHELGTYKSNGNSIEVTVDGESVYGDIEGNKIKLNTDDEVYLLFESK